MKALYVARRDLVSTFHSMWGWAVIAAMLMVAGVLFNIFAMQERELLSHQVLQQFFYTTGFTVNFAAVLLAMRSFAEESTHGTDVILHTSPISDGAIVFGKWLGVMGVLTLYTLLTLYMPGLIFVHGKVSVGHIAVGYLGMLCMGGAVAGIGVFMSSLVRSQMVAGLLTAVLVFLLIGTWYLAEIIDPPFTSLFESMALYENVMPFIEGRLMGSKVLYYLSITFGSLFLTTRMLEGRRWR